MLDGTERSMIPILRNRHNSLSVATEGMTLLEEFSAGTGIADLVFFKAEKTRLKKRVGMSIPAVTDIRELELISIMGHGDTMTEEQIYERVGRSRVYVEKLLLQLLNRNVITYSGEGYRSNLNFSDSAITRTIAIEAKVKDWKSGIKQALRYKEFADYSYLAIYEHYSKQCVAHRHLFEQLGLGLLLITADGEVKEEIAPAQNLLEKSVLKNFLASERYYSIIDETQQTYMVRNFLSS